MDKSERGEAGAKSNGSAGSGAGHCQQEEFITEQFAFDGGRQVTVFVPAKSPEAIIFAGDGQRTAKWGQLLEGTGAPPTMVVGVHGLEDETRRLNEYSLGFDPARFDAHEEFFVIVVRDWIKTRFNLALPRAKTAVFGASAGGELALALGVRHPSIYGAILCASPGAGYKPPTPLPREIPRTYLVAGSGEQFFLDNARRWAEALREAKAELVIKVRDGSHGGNFWQEEFPRMAAWAFK